MQSFQQSKRTTWVVERPAAQDSKSRGLDVVRREFVGQNRKAEKSITLQLFRDVKPIFTQSPGTGGERRDQTYLHRLPPFKPSRFDVLSGEDVGSARQERSRFKRSKFLLRWDDRDMAVKNERAQDLLANISLQSIL